MRKLVLALLAAASLTSCATAHSDDALVATFCGDQGWSRLDAPADAARYREQAGEFNRRRGDSEFWLKSPEGEIGLCYIMANGCSGTTWVFSTGQDGPQRDAEKDSDTICVS